jgi:hypothetical protein
VSAIKPEGVRIIRPDGTEVPCELVYVGKEDGLDVWEVAGALVRPGDSLHCKMLPARTTLVVGSR